MDHRRLNISGGGTYDLYEEIGRGAMAIIYRAKDTKTGKIVAVKVIKRDSKMREDEIKLHMRIDHPSIVKAFDAHDTGDVVYLVMEYCPNGTLHDYMQQRRKEGIHDRLPESQVKKFFKQIVNGIDCLQRNNISHRDLKMANILLDENLNVKIADFGLATKRDPVMTSNNKTICGTPNYMAPEIVACHGHGSEVDLWSLGILVYTMLVGSPPFDSASTSSTWNRIVTAHVKLPNFLSAQAKDLLCGLLQKDPSKRLTVDQIKRHPFYCKNSPERSMDSGHFSYISANTSYNHSSCYSINQSTTNVSLNLHQKYSSSSSINQELIPFNTKRLQPYRSGLINRSITQLLPDGRVSIEILGKKWSTVVTNIILFSFEDEDKVKIEIYKPEEYVPSENPPPPPPGREYKCFTHKDLPSRYWVTYHHAVRFIEAISAWHLKVVSYSKEAKYMLMENNDLLIRFTDGSQIKKSRGRTDIILCTGETVQMLTELNGAERLPHIFQDRLKKLNWWHEQMQKTAKFHELNPVLDCSFEKFPAKLGNKSDFTSSVSKHASLIHSS